jgi:hypothetical protein
MVAACTTSLPEHTRQGRNYDYRYAWIRDQCYAGQAVAKHGAHPLMDDAVRFVTERLLTDGSQLTPAYTVDGGPVPDQRRLQLAGYPGGSDIVGNWVNQQFQLDAFGEALLLFARPPDTTTSTPTAGGRSMPRSPRSSSAGTRPTPMPACGRSTPMRGRTAG